jgi:hypothetical protein
MTRKRATALLLAGALALATVALVACSQTASVTQQSVVGDWAERDGGVIHIDADGTFVASQLTVDPISGRSNSDFDGSGTWLVTASDATDGKLTIEWQESNGVTDVAGLRSTFQFKGTDNDMRLAILELDTDQDIYLTKR